MRTLRGWGPWQQEYYSICSAHGDYNENCDNCKCGMWHNVWLHNIIHFIYIHDYSLWFFLNNGLPWKTKSQKFLEKTFPNLRSK